MDDLQRMMPYPEFELAKHTQSVQETHPEEDEYDKLSSGSKNYILHEGNEGMSSEEHRFIIEQTIELITHEITEEEVLIPIL